MTPAVAEAILAEYPGRKLTLETARPIVVAWARAKGWDRDRWGNFKLSDTSRVKITKRRLQRQTRYEDGRWGNLRSTPLIEAAHNLVEKAADVLGDEAVLAKVGARKQKRSAQQTQRAEKAREEKRKRAVEAMAAKVVSMESPMGFLAMYETDRPSEAFSRRYAEVAGQIDRLANIGRMPTDEDFFRTTHPPLAPVLIESEAEWVEEIDDVPYTVTLRHAGQQRAVIELGAVGSMGVTNRVDPISKQARPDFADRAGDSYISGYVQRRPGKSPLALLFLIQSQTKQRGAGSRVLDLWCNLMDSFGVDAWVAQAVGDEGQAFLARKVDQGRLETIGERGQDLVMRCIGGYRGRQQRLPFVKNPADVLAFER